MYWGWNDIRESPPWMGSDHAGCWDEEWSAGTMHCEKLSWTLSSNSVPELGTNQCHISLLDYYYT